MNIYKNLMFLHGHFVDPRDADDEPAPAPVASAPVSRRAQAARPAGWSQWWLRLWPAQSARIASGCIASVRVASGCDGARCA